MFSRLTTALPVVLVTISALVAPSLQFLVCCNALVQLEDPRTLGGLNCTQTKILDCGFGGQVTAECARFAPIGPGPGTGIGCKPALVEFRTQA